VAFALAVFERLAASLAAVVAPTEETTNQLAKLASSAPDAAAIRGPSEHTENGRPGFATAGHPKFCAKTRMKRRASV
jgi:hypothetical protein